VDVDARLWLAQGPHTDARLRCDARGRYDGIRQELAEGIKPRGRHGLGIGGLGAPGRRAWERDEVGLATTH
jgi:hypothetical protein